MNFYRLTVAYKGTRYDGWQSQPSGNTVQDNIESKLRLLVQNPDLRILSASRTDAGVHAERQIVVFKSEQELDMHRIFKSLNGLLPSDIAISEIEKTNPEFHPILDAESKVYRYRIYCGFADNPFFSDLVWKIFYELNLDLMKSASQTLIGTHDFSNFCAADSTSQTKTRTIYDIIFEYESPKLINIWFHGNGFLKQMIRRIVGTLVEAGREKMTLSEVKQMLDATKKAEQIKTAPAQGLTLVKIIYDETTKLHDIIREASTGFKQSM